MESTGLDLEVRVSINHISYGLNSIPNSTQSNEHLYPRYDRSSGYSEQPVVLSCLLFWDGVSAAKVFGPWLRDQENQRNGHQGHRIDQHYGTRLLLGSWSGWRCLGIIKTRSSNIAKPTSLTWTVQQEPVLDHNFLRHRLGSGPSSTWIPACQHRISKVCQLKVSQGQSPSLIEDRSVVNITTKGIVGQKVTPNQIPRVSQDPAYLSHSIDCALQHADDTQRADPDS